MNRTLKLLMISDIVLLTGLGLISPILAIFIKENLIGGTIAAAGIAGTIYLISKSIVQLPFAKYIDSHDHKVKFLILGTFIIALTPFLYIFSTHIYQIYLAQFLYGIGAGLAYPCWLSLYSTNLDKKHEGFEWSVYSTSVGIGVAIAAAIGATMAQFIGFRITFIITGIFALAGAAILIGLEKKAETLKKTKSKHYHNKRKVLNHEHV
ncbi:MAG: MFS transporter [Candidatus Nanoarchaeia archaeon]|nr:MFS transporter [Candidatus Nanoarchaeia archaeon]